MEAVIYRCCRCGKETDWEESLGSEALCAMCWDSEADVVTPAERRALYREERKDEIKAYRRVYSEVNKAEIQEYRRGFVITHREQLRKYRNEYYRLNVEFSERVKEYQRAYYKRNKERIILRKREYRKARLCSQGCKAERSISVP